ncbi:MULTISPECIES: prephenate/arogenate dehydrogenase [Cyanophyceae]|uniref:prephenate/arogenate dehydrogenase n=1 Tax=Cyanophyceae TaxID=3028117 RepID=UPI001685ACEA|nr:prephenate/arogenate dehydrogenase [Trichocoleus sp. FACHB-69]MBD1931545.1 prephenate/arogenate dehydrogenase [Trichocoleus sp. FACHB-69]
MNIGIVGLGLIGGSLGLDLRAAGYQVLGVSRRDKVCRDAIARGVVDDAAVDMALLAAADVVFVCTPISAIASTVQQLIPHLSPHAIITDVGSVKKSVVEEITPLWANFVGGHPMAGTAESGLEAAVQNLFVGKAYVLTPVATTPPGAVKTVEEIVRSLEAKIYHCSPENHDKAVAWISHLPVMVSATIIDACISKTDPVVLELAQQLASSGFRDTSRVGGGNPELGLMMARYNRLELLQSLQQYRHCLDEIISQIEQEDWNSLHSKLTTTQSKRSQFC